MRSRDLTLRVNASLVAILLFAWVGLSYATDKLESHHGEILNRVIENDVVRLSNDNSEYAIGRKLHVLVDTSNSLRIDDILSASSERWSKSSVDVPGFGFSNGSFWAYFDVENVNDSEKEWLLEFSDSSADRIQLYVVKNGRAIRRYDVGTDRPFSNRPIRHRNFVFPLQFQADEKARIYLQVQSENSVKFPLTLWTERQLLESDQLYLLAQGFYYGAMMVMAIYNLFVFFSIRDRAYIFYVLYVISFSLFQLSTQGLAYQYLWPEAVSWSKVSGVFLPSLTLVFVSIFIMDFLALRKHARKLYYVLQLSVIVAAISAVASFVVPYGLMVKFIALFSGFVCVVGLTAGFYLWHQGHIIARFFSIAFMCLFLGVLMLVLNRLGILPHNFMTERGAQIGAILEVFLLSLALAERINREKRKRYRAQKIALEELAGKEKVEGQLTYQSLHDPLIGCPNRTLLKRRVEALIKDTPDRPFAVLLVQMTRFHEINNTLGHQNGDEILKRVSRRLAMVVNEVDTVIVIDENDHQDGGYAVLEGVSFCIILDLSGRENDGTNFEMIEQTSTKLLQALSYPFEFKGMTLEVSANVGVSIFPEHGDEIHVLLQHAHVAVEMAHKGNDFVVVYSSDVDPYSARRLVLVGELRSAIMKDELQLYYQPQLDLAINAVVGAEALLRWVHPEHGFIPPDEFVLVAEQTGLIKPLTEWVLDNAIRQTADFMRRGYHLKVSVNLSAKNLQERDLVSQLLMLLDRYDLPPSYLVLEITETAMMFDPNRALETLRRINECGIGLSIDDFGTGYSSLSYLKQLPVNEIKIDRSFVMEMSSGSDDEVIVNTTLRMSHSLGLKVVAEGVEDKEVLKTLREMGCDFAQGYYFSRPIPPEEFILWLDDCEYAVGNTVNTTDRDVGAGPSTDASR